MELAGVWRPLSFMVGLLICWTNASPVGMEEISLGVMGAMNFAGDMADKIKGQASDKKTFDAGPIHFKNEVSGSFGDVDTDDSDERKRRRRSVNVEPQPSSEEHRQKRSPCGARQTAAPATTASAPTNTTQAAGRRKRAINVEPLPSSEEHRQKRSPCGARRTAAPATTTRAPTNTTQAAGRRKRAINVEPLPSSEEHRQKRSPCGAAATTSAPSNTTQAAGRRKRAADYDNEIDENVDLLPVSKTFAERTQAIAGRFCEAMRNLMTGVLENFKSLIQRVSEDQPQEVNP